MGPTTLKGQYTFIDSLLRWAWEIEEELELFTVESLDSFDSFDNLDSFDMFLVTYKLITLEYDIRTYKNCKLEIRIKK